MRLKSWMDRLRPMERKAPLRSLLAGQPAGRRPAGDARRAYLDNPVAHRCVRLIAESAAAAPLRVCGEDSAAEAARSLLQRPHPDQSGPELLEAFYGHLQIYGEAFVELAEAAGARALFLLRPDRMRVLAGPRGWADGWEHRAGAERRVFQRDRASGRSPILHLALFNPLDDHRGAAPLQAAALSIDVHDAGGEWTRSLLTNSARPSGALVVDVKETGRLTEDQYARLREELDRLHAGPGAAGRPILLEGGLDWRPLGLSPAEMDFIEARREAAREIALAFGAPPMLLGLPGDNTYANYKEANLAFVRQTVLPLARKTAAALSAWLSPHLGAVRVEVDEEALPALAEDRARKWTRIGEADFLTQAEKRRLLGLSQTPDGASV